MANSAETESGLKRVPSGIAGLDTILRGGFFEGGLYVVSGVPGTGKTTLANQMCFSHVKSGGRALYVTLLAESHARMLQYMRTMTFFDASVIPASLYYVSGFLAVEEQGLKGLLELLRQEIAAHNATLLVIDGFLTAAALSPSESDFRKFIHQLQINVSAAGCTAILTTNDLRGVYRPEHTMVDGIIRLERTSFGARTQWQLEVEKLRGSDFLVGKHSHQITTDGILVFPRVEALFNRPSFEDRSRGERTSIGVAELDRMLGGGIPSGTTTLLLGPSGVGKTILGLHFVVHASSEEPALFFTFYETPPRLRMKAQSLNLDLDRLVTNGRIEVIWEPPAENMLDALAQRLLMAIERRGVRRLFIDGLGGMEEAALYPDRLPHFFAALFNELRTRDVTTIYTGETQVILSSEVVSPVPGLSMIAENILLMRFIEDGAKLHRLLSILKVRDSAFDPSMREFRIAGDGIHLTLSTEPISTQVGSSGKRLAAKRKRPTPERRARR